MINFALRGLRLLGWNPEKSRGLLNLPMYFRQLRAWKRLGGDVARLYPILHEYDDIAGRIGGHYFHQDLLVAKYVYQDAPERHVDIGSRIDGFVSHVASFREIEVYDIRPLPQTAHTNIHFKQADLMEPGSIPPADSVSCLHVIEHFGLGRYGDRLDVNGHRIGITQLISIVKPGGRLYISFPIGRTTNVQFNAHRVFSPDEILTYDEVKNHLELERFDYVDDVGDLHLNKSIEDAAGRFSWGCGIYTFRRKLDS